MRPTWRLANYQISCIYKPILYAPVFYLFIAEEDQAEDDLLMSSLCSYYFTEVDLIRFCLFA